MRAPAGSTIWLLLVRGDHALNEVKADKLEPLKGGFRFATEAEILEHFGCRPGYLGPIGLAKPVKVIADRTRCADGRLHLRGANAEWIFTHRSELGRDLHARSRRRPPQRGRRETPPDGQGRLAIQRGIGVGHVFYLGTKYWKR